MQTKLINMIETINKDDLEIVVQLLQQGEIVAFPTETVYGLGADATNEDAVHKIFKAKGRPSDNPLIVHVATKEQLYSLVTDVFDYVDKLIDTFSPGPITYVLKSANKVANIVTAGLSTVGVRIPSDPIALAIIRASNLPLAAPSANRSGKPSPTKAEHVIDDLFGEIAAVVDGGQTDVGLESTVIDCTGSVPIILRPGAITADEIAEVVGECHIYDKGKTTKTPKSPKSPGLKYVHYAPEVPLLLVKKNRIEEVIHHEKTVGKKIALLYESASLQKLDVAKKVHLMNDETEVAKQLYSLLRSFKKETVDVIIFEYPSLSENSAIIDRLKRAATKLIE